MPSAYETVRHLQDLRAGDVLPGSASAGMGMGFTLVTHQPARALVMALHAARGRIRTSSRRSG